MARLKATQRRIPRGLRLSDVDRVNQMTRHALGSQIPQRAWMTPGGERGGEGVSTLNEVSTTEERHSGPTEPPAPPQTSEVIATDQVSNRKGLHEDEEAAKLSLLITPRATSEASTSSTDQKLGHAVSQSGDISAKADLAPQLVDLVDQAIVGATPLQVPHIIDAVLDSIPPKGSILSLSVWVPPSTERTLVKQLELFRTLLRATGCDEVDDSSSSTGRRMALIEEALRDRDYYFLLLNQAVTMATPIPAKQLTESPIAALRLGDFFHDPESEAINSNVATFCSRFPINQSLITDQTAGKEKLLSDLLNMQAEFGKHMEACADLLKNNWAEYVSFCVNSKSLPLAQDLASDFGIFSMVLQRVMFGEIMRGIDIDEDTAEVLQDNFVQSQKRLQAHTPLGAKEALEASLQNHSLLDGAKLTSLSNLTSLPSSRFAFLGSPSDMLDMHGIDRYKPGSFRPDVAVPHFTRDDSVALFVSDTRLGPFVLPFRPVTQTYTFLVTSEEFTSLVTRKAANREGEKPVLHFTDHSCSFRLRMCRCPADGTITPAVWLSERPIWALWAYATINGHILELPHLIDNGRVRPYDLSEMIIPGLNTLVMSLNRSSAGTINHSIGIAVEVISAVAIETVVSGCGDRQTLPAEQVIDDIKSRLAGGADDEIMVINPNITITLTEPFSNCRIFDVPVRSKTCKHDQPFDLGVFLESRPKRGDYQITEQMKCPICGADARPSELIVDGFLVDVRKRLEEMGKLDTQSITVDDKGQWNIKQATHEKPGGNDATGQKKQCDQEIMELDDD